MKLSTQKIAEIADGKLSLLTGAEMVRSVEFDSRLVTPGSLFVPLKGARDGHDFIATAFLSGAVATFSERAIDAPHILVTNALSAFQALARYVLDHARPTVIAVTGSNGKTTTKDMIAAVLSEKFVTYKTQGNHNNEIGLPYTILHMPRATEKLVLEMGMDHPGDIDFLSALAEPDFAVITLIGEAHLEFMGSREAIAKGKMGITKGLHGELVAPADPLIERFIPENLEITRFGDGAELHITKLIEHKDRLSFEVSFLDATLTVPVPGKYNATNAMLAAYVGMRYGVPDSQIKHALAHVSLTKNRTEWLKAANGADILSDVYNANPTAMRLILETFQAIPRNKNGRKMAVLADMLELGVTAPELHAAVADSITALDGIYLYGPLMAQLAARLPHVQHFETLEQLTKAVVADLAPDDQLLVKGSNGMKLSELILQLTEK
ncbi:MAG: UDP-N-acetylmuramoyl-tripeptide--D-alanyl-D-alanine ligase [Streptococcaceae bacterium]|nr:UDP-N-acetylmuramoyl-tripeptide--D-alanyl-D-alanine ligase [Streptococcaceae bacterium]